MLETLEKNRLPKSKTILSSSNMKSINKIVLGLQDGSQHQAVEYYEKKN